MKAGHSLLGCRINGQNRFYPLAGGIKINRKLSLVGMVFGKGNAVYDQIAFNGKFSLNIFSGKMLECLKIDSFQLPDCKEGRSNTFNGSSGSPLLEDSPLALECRVYDAIHLQDYTLFMAEITDSWSYAEPFTRPAGKNSWRKEVSENSLIVTDGYATMGKCGYK